MFIYMKIVGNTRGMSLLSFAGDSHRSWCVCQLASFPVNILGFSNGSVCYFIDNYLDLKTFCIKVLAQQISIVTLTM